MAFQVIPAIDVSGGRLARQTPSGAVPIDAFGGDPLEAAGAFIEAGAGWLHVVDMDLAATGEPANLDLLRNLAPIGVPVQASGGVASGAHVAAILEAGASRVVLGSGALVDRDETGELVARFGESLVVGIEADGPAIRPRGRGGPELPLRQTLAWLSGLPVARYLYTDVRRAGALDGPDLDGVRAIATSTRRPVLAAGGIRDAADVRRLAALGGAVEGAIVGRALYQGLDLRDALAAIA